MPDPNEVAVVDYGMGNLRSVERALVACGGRVRIVGSPDQVGDAAALVFPGQGAIVDAMRRLRATGFDELIRDWIAADRPFLGICLGLQVLFDHSEEGDTPALGIFPGQVRRFRFAEGSGFKVPHMGWNAVAFRKSSPLAEGLESGDQFYFVHSYRVSSSDESLVWTETDYGGDRFVSGICRGNCHATQFHPEKSQAKGLQIYRNFLNHTVFGNTIIPS